MGKVRHIVDYLLEREREEKIDEGRERATITAIKQWLEWYHDGRITFDFLQQEVWALLDRHEAGD
jgi:hypothetical protein